MAAVSLTTLRARARERADMTGSAFVADGATSLDNWLNEGAHRLHALLAEKFGNDYIVKSAAFPTAAGTSSYSLTTYAPDLFKLLGVDLTVGTRPVDLKKFNFKERNAYRAATSAAYGAGLPRYHLEGAVLRLYPAPNAVYSGTIWYIPMLQVLQGGSGSTYINLLTSATDTVDFPNGWEAWIEIHAAIQARIKEESDIRELVQEREKLEAEIEKAAENRDAGTPMSAVDVELADADPFGIY